MCVCIYICICIFTKMYLYIYIYVNIYTCIYDLIARQNAKCALNAVAKEKIVTSIHLCIKL